MLEDVGKNCKECGQPMEAHETFCGRCGTEYIEKKRDNDSLGKWFKIIIFIVLLPFLIGGGIVTFPIGTIGAIAVIGAMWHYWFGKGKEMGRCRCCGKEISKEAVECPKCGCPRPIY